MTTVVILEPTARTRRGGSAGTGQGRRGQGAQHLAQVPIDVPRLTCVADPQYPVAAVYLNLAHPFSVLGNGGRLPGIRQMGTCGATLHESPRRRPR